MGTPQPKEGLPPRRLQCARLGGSDGAGRAEGGWRHRCCCRTLSSVAASTGCPPSPLRDSARAHFPGGADNSAHLPSGCRLGRPALVLPPPVSPCPHPQIHAAVRPGAPLSRGRAPASWQLPCFAALPRGQTLLRLQVARQRSNTCSYRSLSATCCGRSGVICYRYLVTCHFPHAPLPLSHKHVPAGHALPSAAPPSHMPEGCLGKAGLDSRPAL